MGGGGEDDSPTLFVWALSVCTEYLPCCIYLCISGGQGIGEGGGFHQHYLFQHRVCALNTCHAVFIYLCISRGQGFGAGIQQHYLFQHWVCALNTCYVVLLSLCFSRGATPYYCQVVEFVQNSLLNIILVMFITMFILIFVLLGGGEGMSPTLLGYVDNMSFVESVVQYGDVWFVVLDSRINHFCLQNGKPNCNLECYCICWYLTIWTWTDSCSIADIVIKVNKLQSRSIKTTCVNTK